MSPYFENVWFTSGYSISVKNWIACCCSTSSPLAILRACFLSLECEWWVQHLQFHFYCPAEFHTSHSETVVQGVYPDVIATPSNVNQEYLDLARLLKMKDLRQNMTLTQFRSAMKLDLNKNLSWIW